MVRPGSEDPQQGNIDHTILTNVPGIEDLRLQAERRRSTGAMAEVLGGPEQFERTKQRALFLQGELSPDLTDSRITAMFRESDETTKARILGAIERTRHEFPLEYLLSMLEVCASPALSEKIARLCMSRMSDMTFELASRGMQSSAVFTPVHRLFAAMALSFPQATVELAGIAFNCYPTDNRILRTTMQFMRPQPAEQREVFARHLTTDTARSMGAIFFVDEFSGEPTGELLEKLDRWRSKGSFLPGRANALLGELCRRADVSITDLLKCLGKNPPNDLLLTVFSYPERLAQLKGMSAS